MLVLQFFLTYIFFKESLGATLKPSVLIVGSGPSGIAAATRLLKNNFTNIKVLEAENRIGGRIFSLEFGDAYVDLGAEYIHGQDGNIVYSMVKDLGIIKHSIGTFYHVLSNGEVIKKDLSTKIYELTESLDNSFDNMNACENVLSIGECLKIKVQEFSGTVKNPKDKIILTQAIDWIKSSVSSLESAFDINDIKMKSDYKLCPGDPEMSWNGHGYKTILDIMMQKYPKAGNKLPIDDKFILQKEVKSITEWQNNEKIVVACTDGSTYEADHVIFTPSVGVLKANHGTLFKPELPKEKIDAINNTGFGAIIKVILHFPIRWWNNDVMWFPIWTDNDKEKLKEMNLEWLIDFSYITPGDKNPKVLTVWYAGSNIPLIETLSDEEIMRGQKYLLNKFLTSQFNVTMPDKMLRTSWYSNPHFRGTYSYASVKGHSAGGSKFQDKLAQPLLNENNNPTVLFAGEATHAYYHSTVHGAIETGYREADRLINLYLDNKIV